MSKPKLEKETVRIKHNIAGDLNYQKSYLSLNLTVTKVYSLYRNKDYEWIIEGINHRNREEIRFSITSKSFKNKYSYLYDLSKLTTGTAYLFVWESNVSSEYLNKHWHIQQENEIRYFLGFKLSKQKAIPILKKSRLRIDNFFNSSVFKNEY